MRLDLYLVECGIFESRNKAQYEIKNSKVTINNKIVTKPSYDVSDRDIVDTLPDTLKYVSKGGLKLEKALEYFNIDVLDKVCLDIGSSTGGFTDCLIQKGAKEVYSIDVGTDQLHELLKSNPKVHSYEKTNFLTMPLDILPKIDIIVTDVSFIKVETILERVISSFKDTKVIFLIKPQFEVGRMYIKNGVIKDESVRLNVKSDILNFLKSHNIKTNEIIDSPILGGSGNKEYLTYFEI